MTKLSKKKHTLIPCIKAHVEEEVLVQGQSITYLDNGACGSNINCVSGMQTQSAFLNAVNHGRVG